MYTLTITYRTKAEAKAAVKAGIVLQTVNPDGTVRTKANGTSPITGKLDHYKTWEGWAEIVDGKVVRIR